MSITSDRIREYGFIHDLADAAADEIDALEAEIVSMQSKVDMLEDALRCCSGTAYMDYLHKCNHT